MSQRCPSLSQQSRRLSQHSTSTVPAPPRVPTFPHASNPPPSPRVPARRDSASAPLGDSPRATGRVNRGPRQPTVTAAGTQRGKGAGGSADGTHQPLRSPAVPLVCRITVRRETPATLHPPPPPRGSPSTDKSAAGGVKLAENGRTQISFAFSSRGNKKKK